MGKGKESLLNLLIEMEGRPSSEVIERIKTDGYVLNASNDYCRQCGKCCMTRCKNYAEYEDGHVKCLLHEDGSAYPHGKIIAGYDMIRVPLDPAQYAKPLLCHTYGPHVACLGIMNHLSKGDGELAHIAAERCPGSQDMYADLLERKADALCMGILEEKE